MAQEATVMAPDKSADYAKAIFDVLVQRRALSLPELLLYVDAPKAEVNRIIQDLENQKLIKIWHRGTPDEIIMIREKGLRAS